MPPTSTYQNKVLEVSLPASSSDPHICSCYEIEATILSFTSFCVLRHLLIEQISYFSYEGSIFLPHHFIGAVLQKLSLFLILEVNLSEIIKLQSAELS